MLTVWRFRRGFVFETVPFTTLLKLYSKLRPGLTLNDWMESDAIHELDVDVRRMISFGVVKGFLRRVHCYPVWLDHPAFAEAKALARTTTMPMTTTATTETEALDSGGVAVAEREGEEQGREADKLRSRGRRRRRRRGRRARREEDDEDEGEEGRRNDYDDGEDEDDDDEDDDSRYPSSLPDLLDGGHSSDELCVRYKVGFARLKRYLAVIGRRSDSTATAPSEPSSDDANDLGRVRLVWI
jgi:hypothetical protein